MEKSKIKEFLNKNPLTYRPQKIVFKDNTFKIGFFEIFDDSDELETKNKYRIIENCNSVLYSKNRDKNLSTIIDGNEIAFFQ